MKTWRQFHPRWEYVLWDDEKIFTRRWVNQKHVDFYRERGVWHGVADLVRYEILYRQGGFMPGADSECLRPVDELFTGPFDAFAVYENERAAPGLISPLEAAEPGSTFAAELVWGLFQKRSVAEPWKTTGNKFMADVYERQSWPKVRVFPSHYLNPVHHTGLRYVGDGPVYAFQHWGSTKRLYG